MFRSILVPLDRSSFAEEALGHAAAIARASNATVSLLLVHEAVAFAGFEDAPWNAEQLNIERIYMGNTATELAAGASIAVAHRVLEGQPVDVICDEANDGRADLVVMTTHGRTGLSRTWLGSVADSVVRHSTAPVLLLRSRAGELGNAKQPHRYQHVLVPLDGTSLSGEVLGAALALARCSNARVTLLRVVYPVPLFAPGADLQFVNWAVDADVEMTSRLVDRVRRDLSAQAAHLAGESGLTVEARVVASHTAVHEILEHARQSGVDLIAMTTRGRGASRLLVGSVADKVMRDSELDMLLLRG